MVHNVRFSFLHKMARIQYISFYWLVLNLIFICFYQELVCVREYACFVINGIFSLIFFFHRRKQIIVNSSKEPLADQTTHEGSLLQITVNLPPTMQEPGLFGESTVFGKVTTIDHTNHRVAWSASEYWRFLLHTERWQALSVDEATGRTKYETIEVF